MITADKVIHGDINNWQDRLLISVNFNIPDEEVESIRQSRLKTHEAISEMFETWRAEKDKKFMDWYFEEGLSWGRVVIRTYIDKMVNVHNIQTGNIETSADEFLSITSNEAVTLINSLMRYIPDHKETSIESLNKVTQYLTSKEVLEVPFIKIGALLWACIRHQAAHGGRKAPPNIGMANDIEMIESLLPYCDAMSIDREMASLLNHGEVKKRIAEYGTKIFSTANKNDFMKFLDDIKDNASKEHMDTIKEVYGEGWPRPFWSMYEHD